MINIGPEKVLVIMAVALIVLGPQELPRVARELGRFMTLVRELQHRVESEARSVVDSISSTAAAPAPAMPTAEPAAPDLPENGGPAPAASE